MSRIPSVLDMPNIRSGSILGDINVTISDFYNQTVMTISETDVHLQSSNPSCRLQGRTSAITLNGIAKFSNLILSCPPGTSIINMLI